MFFLKLLSLIFILSYVVILAFSASTPPNSSTTKAPLVLSKKGQKIEGYIDHDLYGNFYHVKSGREMRVGHLIRAGENALKHPDPIISQAKVSSVLKDVENHLNYGNLKKDDSQAIHDAIEKARKTNGNTISQPLSVLFDYVICLCHHTYLSSMNALQTVRRSVKLDPL